MPGVGSSVQARGWPGEDGQKRAQPFSIRGCISTVEYGHFASEG